ncbi:MAG: lipid A export permease/ATP-binding protein MsbA [Spongiibacteraceae bacterium]
MNSATPVEYSRLQVYWRLLAYLKPYTGIFILSLCGFLVFGLTEPLQAKMLGVFTHAVQEKDYNARYYIPLMLIGLYLLRGVSSFIGAYCLSKVSNGIVHDLRVQAFQHVVYLPTRFYEDNNSGHIISQIIYNTGQVTAAVTDALRTVVREGFTVLGLFAYVFYLNWKMSLIFIAVAPIVGFLVARVGNKLRSLSKKMQRSAAELTQICNEMISGHRVVRSFRGEEYEVNRFKKVSYDSLRRALKMTQVSSMSTPILQLVLMCAMGFIMFLILQPAFMSQMSAPDYITYVGAIALLAKPMRQLGEINGVIQKGIAAAESVFEVLDLDPEVNTGTKSGEHIRGDVEIRNLSFAYPEAEKRALDNINLSIKPGQTVALVGRSGSGKSTLASLMTQFYRHEQGAILIDGVEVHDYDIYALREKISVVTQSVTLFNDTIANNIAYGVNAQKYDMAAIREAAKQAYALDFIEALPEQFNTIIGENGVKLSGGQKQRIAIARALLKNAPILLLDEATSALDNESERYIQLALEHAKIGRTTIVIAHRLSTIESADLIAVMDQGKIVESGTHHELIARRGHYARLYEQGFNE